MFIKESQLKTDNEIKLWHAQQQGLLLSLKGRVSHLNQKFATLENMLAETGTKQETESRMEYSTEKEKPAKEKEWTIKKN